MDRTTGLITHLLRRARLGGIRVLAVARVAPVVAGVLLSHSARSQTDVFPLNPGLHFQYRYQSLLGVLDMSGYGGPSQYWRSDSGVVAYTVLDSSGINDSTCVWRVMETCRVLHRYHDILGNDSVYWKQDSTCLELQESLRGPHHLTVSGLIWRFPVAPYYNISRPVSRYSDTLGVVIAVRWYPPGTYGEGNDTLWFSPGGGLHKRHIISKAGSMLLSHSYEVSADLMSVTGLRLDAIVERAGSMLGQNYPNPFNPSTTIRYGISGRSHVLLTVFNALGQLVEVLQNGEQEAGYYQIRFDGTHLPSGMYLCCLQAGRYTETKKLLLVR